MLETAARAKKEQERKATGTFAPFRYYLKKGEECEIIILDESVESGIAFYEHNLQDGDGIWSIHEPCIKDLGTPCPICERYKDSSYTLFLTCLVLKSFTTKKGVVIPHSKMLLPVKLGQFDLFRQLEKAAKDGGGSMRGMYLIMKRGTESTSARIGEPVIQEGGKVFDLISEEELDEEYGHDAIVGQDGKTVIRPENFDITPYDYKKIFPRPDVQDILNRYGSGGGAPRAAAAGSAAEVIAEFEDDVPMGDDAPAPAAATRTRRAAAPAPAEPEPAARTRRRTAAAPEPEAPARTRRRAAAPAGGEPFGED
jgi:hypothetical protein